MTLKDDILFIVDPTKNSEKFRNLLLNNKTILERLKKDKDLQNEYFKKEPWNMLYDEELFHENIKGTKSLNDTLEEINKRIVTSNHLLVPFVNSYLKFNNFSKRNITSFESAIDALGEEILQKGFKIEREIKTSKGIFSYKIDFDNVKISGPITKVVTNKFPDLPTRAIKQGDTYSLIITTDMNISFKNLSMNTKKSISNFISTISSMISGKRISVTVDDHDYDEKIIQTKNISFKIPNMVGCKYCSSNALTLREAKYICGEDPYENGGYFIINGQELISSGRFSNPYNLPTIRKVSGNKPELFHVELLSKNGVQYEHSVNLSLTLSRKYKEYNINLGNENIKNNKKNIYNIVMTIKPMFGKESYKIPIRAIFKLYGCQNDSQIANYIIPGSDKNDLNEKNKLKLQILSSIFLENEDQLKTYEYKSLDEIYFYFAEKSMSEHELKSLEDKCKNEAILVTDHQIIKDSDGVAISVNELTKKIKKLRMIEYTKKYLKKNIIPHIKENDRYKCLFFGRLINDLLDTLLGFRSISDYDTLERKRVHLIGTNIAQEIKRLFNMNIVNPITSKICECLNTSEYTTAINNLNTNLNGIISTGSDKLNKSLIKAFNASETKIINGKEFKPKIITSINERKSVFTYWSKLHELALDKKAADKQSDAAFSRRCVHESHCGFICPVFTPENGKSVGMSKQTTMITEITEACDPKALIDEIQNYPKFIDIDKSDINNIKNDYIISVNGSYIGFIKIGKDVIDFCDYFRNIIRSNKYPKISNDIGLRYDIYDCKIEFWTDRGRLYYPALRINYDKQELPISKEAFKKMLQEINLGKLSWNDIFNSGIFDNIDQYSANNAVICKSYEKFLNKKDTEYYTHIMLPCGLLGLIAQNTQGITREKVLRGSYITNHIKQGVGLTVYNLGNRMDIELFHSHIMQTPLVSTLLQNALDLKRYANGMNVVVAFYCAAENQEDAIIINKGSVNRGIFKLSRYVPVTNKTDSKRFKNNVEIDEIKDIKGNIQSYTNLDEDGFPKHIGQKINKGDVIIGAFEDMSHMERKEEINEKLRYIDRSIISKDSTFQNGQEIIITYSGKQNIIEPGATTIRKIRLRSERPPILGDKFATFHGQKGTIGGVRPEYLMPYTKDGMVPTILVNIWSIFKRETHGQTWESIAMYILAALCCKFDGTPFLEKLTLNDIQTIANSMGMNPYGKTEMYDPVTGFKIKTKICCVPTYYIRQKHMVEDKIHIRYGGPLKPLERQPVAGRANGGGHSFEQMSKITISAGGATESFKGCNQYNSGPRPEHIYICSNCGDECIVTNGRNKNIICNKCTPNGLAQPKAIEKTYISSLITKEAKTAGVDIIPGVIDKEVQMDYSEFNKMEFL